ncbi:MAG: 3-deoxy-8-phosphooctulonate synthase, partial [Deltaproteobacteria bacterium]
MKPVEIGDIVMGGGNPLVLVAGPCVIESEQHLLDVGAAIKRMSRQQGVPFILKSSFDKA